MEEFQEFLAYPILTVANATITVGRAAAAVTVVLGLWILYNLLERLLIKRLEHSHVGADFIHLMRRLFLVAAIVVAVTTTLELLDIPITAFAFVSGAIAIGVGFGAQNIINNFISGWILMWERPIRIGDFIELNEMRGTVEAINTRSTRIRRTDGVHMLVPNSFLLENAVVNWTLIDRLTRTIVRVGVAYGSPVEKVRELLYQAMQEDERIIGEPATTVLFEDFGDNSLVFDAVFWVLATAERDLRVIRSDLRFRINELFIENDIVISFPQRDVHLDTSRPLEIKMLKPD